MSHLAERSVAIAQPDTRRPLRDLCLIFCVLACYWAVVIHQLGAQWSVYAQYHYGWVVPLLCGYLAWRRIQAPEPGAVQTGGIRGGVLVPALCALAFAPTRFLHEANPIWRLTSFLLALEVVVLTLCFVYLIGGFAGLRKFLFPVCFFLVAVPWPSGLENFLVQTLTRWNVAATVELLGLMGIPAIQHGNVIEIGTGMVGIDEACSGIRSLQATFMISLFLGEFYLLGIGRRALCVAAAVACSFVFNLGRTSLLTWVGATKGTAAISQWHDPAGVTILLACFLSLWLLAWLLARNEPESRTDPGPLRAVLRGVTGGFAPGRGSRLSWLFPAACALGVWLALVELGTEGWFRWHERRAAAAAVWGLNSGPGRLAFKNVRIPGDVLGQFRADESAHWLWRDGDGIAWQLYYFRWMPGQSLDRRVAVQLAKTHGPEKCLPAIGMTLKSDLGVITVPAGRMRVAFRQYLFTVEGQPLHVFYGIYEDLSGSAVLANRRKNAASRVAAALDGSRNFGQSFLEIAVAGPEEPGDARAALERALPSLITVEK